MKLIIESSRVPIYDRIARAFASALIVGGHTVYFIDASEFTDEDFVRTINNLDIEYYFSTNELNKVQSRSRDNSHFLFERLSHRVIFVHHDNVFSCYNDLETISAKLSAYKESNDRCEHFFLEESNVQLFKRCGIDRAKKILHASEFTGSSTPPDLRFGASFIGHLMSSLKLYPEDQVQAGHHLVAQAWLRLSDSSHPIQPAIEEMVANSYLTEQLTRGAKANSEAIRQYLVAGLNKFSSAYRGELISKIKGQRVDIFGGDLSYGKMSDPLLILRQPNIHYQPATVDYQQARDIYRSSKININISSLQFDSAINNRVVDAVMSGGFILTDDRSDLSTLGELRQHITFRSPEELVHKVDYWLHGDNNKKYLEIKNALIEIVSKRHSYKAVLGSIFENLN